MERRGCDRQTTLHAAVAEAAATACAVQQVVISLVSTTAIGVVIVSFMSFAGKEVGAVNRFDVFAQ